MKSRFSRRRNALVGRAGFAGMTAAALVIVILALRLIAPSWFMALAVPIVRAGASLSGEVRAVTGIFADKVHLERERDAAVAAQNALTEQNRTLSAKVADLTALLGSRTEAPPGIVAAVLARPPVSPYDELVLDAGEAEGVREGAAVYGNGGVPLGIVASVTAHAARVALYSAPGRETPALAGAARVPFTLVGAGAGAFTASVPRDAGVAVGDALYAGGAGSIPIGTVAAVDSDPSSPSAAIRIDPVANPFSITWVTVAPAP